MEHNRMSAEDKLDFAVYRFKRRLLELARECHITDGKWHTMTVYFRVQGNEIDVDDLRLADADKACRRKDPRIKIQTSP